MRKKLCIFSIGAAALLILTCVPSIASQPHLINTVNSAMKTSQEYTGDSEIIKINVYHLKEGGVVDKTLKEITKGEHEAMMAELKQATESGSNLREIFESKLQIMKNYEVVPDDLTLEDIIDVDKLTGPYEPRQGEDFSADFAPLFFMGGGFGFGIGIPFLITSGTFLIILFGFGIALCYDFFNKVLYSLFTMFFIPLLVGYLGGFLGLILLPVLPGFFYSNLVGLGMVAKTRWRMVPSLNMSSV